MAAGTSPRLAIQRINAGWSEDKAINFESRALKMQREREPSTEKFGPRFAVCKPGVEPVGPMPLTARPDLMAKCLVQSGMNKNVWLRENTQGEVIQQLINQVGDTA